MLNVKIIRNVVKTTDGQMQLQVEVKQGPTLTAILRELVPGRHFSSSTPGTT